MKTSFYRAFEDKYRGSRELITARLRVYLPYIQPLALIHPERPVLDLGCGRGEWLELLHQHQINAYGMDLDEGMLSACRERGLNVTQGDALAHLQAQPDQSLLAVTGFHIAEHLPFVQLQTLFAQAHRVLMPGGLLILETPNPENLLVGTANFYIDPTHQRPLPSQLLTFLAEHQGFGPVQLLRLQEEARLANRAPRSLYDVLANVSPDYAIVAQLPAAPDQPNTLAPLFEAECGVSLHTLASRYDQHLQARHAEQLHAAHTAQRRAEEALALAQQAWRQPRALRWLTRLIRRPSGPV